jgi:lipopolysaccharide export system permease protein
MFKIYIKYIIKKFLNKFIFISLIFLSLIFILNIFEEISFFKNISTTILTPYFLTFLNTPIILFELFPFIFLLSTQIFFNEILIKNELTLLKNVGLSNLKIITTLFFFSVFIGFLIIVLYYNLASKFKFYYTDIKNNYSNDNKYLAVVNESGLWLKDQTEEGILIVKSSNIKDNYLNNVIINQFDFDFNHLKTIQSDKIDISNKNWIIEKPVITIANITSDNQLAISIKSNFDKKKINSLFSNFLTLNIWELFYLKTDYEKLGYSSNEVMIHLLKLFSSPFLYGLMTILASIIMFNTNKINSLFLSMVLGILVSVFIYYINFMFVSLGNTGKIPNNLSIFLPIFFIFIINLFGLTRINEK